MFNTRYLEEYRDEIRLDLKDTNETIWGSDELNRCIRRAVDELSRSYPLESIYEYTLDFDVAGEVFAAPAAGTWKNLANKPIQSGSETVTNAAGTITYTLDTDYTMDYANGRYTIITGGAITALDSLLFTYTKSKLGINAAAVITNMIRITGVEYPVGEVPQKSVSYNIFGDFMHIGSQEAGSSQTELVDGKHIAIYYEKPHTPPEEITAPSYPAFLDEVICIGAAGYALLIESLQYELQAITDLASLRTSLGSIAAVHTLLQAALVKITTYLENNSGNDAKSILTAITTQAADLRTAITTALNAMNAYLDEVDTTDLGLATYGAEAQTVAGVPFINVVGLGLSPADRYADYARARVEIANARNTAALAYGQEANQRLDVIRTYIDQAAGYGTGWNQLATTFISEASARIAEIDRYISESGQYQIACNTDLLLADRFRAEAASRLADFRTILKDKSEYRRRTSSVPLRQPA